MTLADWLKAEGKTVTWLAEQLSRDRSYITRVRNGDAMPSVEVAAEIQRLSEGAVTAIDYVRVTRTPATVSPELT